MAPDKTALIKTEDVELRAAKKAAKKAAKHAMKEAQANEDGTKEEKKKKKKKKESKRKAEEAAVVDSDPSSTEEQTAKKKRKKEQKKAEGAANEEAPCAPRVEAWRKEHDVGVPEGSDASALPAPILELGGSDWPFGDACLGAMKAAGFTAPSPIQAQGWPVALSGRDLIAVAKTGSGKTLAFLLPLLLGAGAPAAKGGPAALVLAPTRELAVQIQAAAEQFGAGASSAVAYGGAPKGPQLAALKKKPALLVATPGRLVDLLEGGAPTCLAGAAALVLDEADRMLDMGFEPQIKKIMAALPPARQTLLFSATWPKAVRRVADGYLRGGEQCVHILVGRDDGELAANTAIKQLFWELDDSEKDDRLWRLLDELPEDGRMVCFTNTKRRADRLAKECLAYGMKVAAIHGDKSQPERDAALRGFTAGEVPVLFATDVAARGLDIRAVTHVCNYDMAADVEQYVHRIGRTGRAGATGVSYTFVNEAYDAVAAPALAKIARDAGQEVPAWLDKLAEKGLKLKGKVRKAWQV